MPVKQNKLQIIPLGGSGETGSRNMMLFEWQRKICIVDMGFGMPEEEILPGVNYIIPDITYLKGRERDIVGVFITHGHYDHIGAIPYIMGKIGNPTMYAGGFAKAIVLKRQAEFPNQPALKIVIIKDRGIYKAGPFVIEAFRQNHSISDSFGFIIKTPVGNIIHTGDFKFDDDPVNEPPTDYKRLEEIGRKGIHLLLSDSTNAETRGHSLSEGTVTRNLDTLFQKAQGRVIISTFGSNINRVQQIITLSEKYGRRIAFEGHSMKTNVELSKQLGYIVSKKGTIIKSQQTKDYPDSKITVCATGAQGEEGAALMKLATGQHRSLRIVKNDTVILSSSVIPGNELSVQYVKDKLYDLGADVYHYRMLDVHASGHAGQDELKQTVQLFKPTYFIPIQGHVSMMHVHANLAKEAGVPEKNIFIPKNGNIVEVTKQGISIAKKKVSAELITVDGLGVGDVGEVVLSDRQNLSKAGMFVIIAVVDRKTGKVKGSPDIISRGFIYMRESKDLLKDMRRKTVAMINRQGDSSGAVNWTVVKDNVKKMVTDTLYKKTERRPIVIAVIIEV